MRLNVHDLLRWVRPVSQLGSYHTAGDRLTILAIRPRVDSIPLADPLTGAGNDSGVKA
jgi:hypothetical protein